MKKVNILVVLILIMVAGVAVFGNSNGKAENVKGFTHEAIQFKNFSFELQGSEYKKDRYTFHFKIINTGDVPINASKTSIEIKNAKGQIFVSEPLKFKTKKMNPNLSTTGEASFIMKQDELEQGKPIMQVEYGYFLDETHEFELIK